jgi:hypothetical protein
VVTRRFHALRIDAERAVSASNLTVATDQKKLAKDQAELSAATATEAKAAGHLGSTQAALNVATDARQQATSRVAKDQARLRGVALGVYTGALPSPQPYVRHTFATAQTAAIDIGEAKAIAQLAVTHLSIDVKEVAAYSRQEKQLVAAVSADAHTLRIAHDRTEAASSRVPRAAAALAGAQQQLAASNRRLAAVQTTEKATLAAVGVDGADPPGLSILGGAALNADQLVGWFTNHGYANLTSAPIAELANWYLTAGSVEGVRGDVAFAQAVLETGGFRSVDAVDRNNFAGIGHCDSCGQGMSFPSAEIGVFGQVELLHIFATGGIAPNPKLTLVGRAGQGCCPTWESLTHRWATDPTYGTQILTLYEGMLEQASARD